MKQLEVSTKSLNAALGIIGLLPALVIVTVIRLREGQLVVAGQAMAEYDLTRLTATLISLLLPVFLILPMALAAAKLTTKANTLAALTAPLWLFGPAILTGVLVGGRGPGAPLMALLLLCLLQWCLCLWVNLLTKLTSLALAVLAYGAVWGISGYVDHLRLYVLPYLETSWASAVGYLSWLLPQVKSGPSLIDDFLTVGELDWLGLGPTALQIPILFAALFLLNRKGTKAESIPQNEA